MEAQFILERILLLFSERNMEEQAKIWLQEAAKQGHMEAQFVLGELLVEEDIDQAKIWLQEAAKQGHMEAQFVLGELLVEEDIDQAKIWLQEAAKQGHMEALRLCKNLSNK